MKRRLLYFHEGKSLYDDFFLDFLKDRYDVTFSTFSRSGAERIRRTTGVRVRVMKDFPIEMESHDTVRRLALTPFRIPFFAAEVQEVDPDVTLACWATSYGFYASAAGVDPYGLLVWGSDVLIQPRYLPVRAFAESALRHASRVFLDSDVQARAAIALGCRRSSIVEFPWIDLTPYFSLKVDRERAREYLGADEDDIVVMWNRRHDWVYAPDVFVRAASLVLKEEPRVKFAMAGQGKLTPSLRELISSLGMGDSFRLLGWVDREDLARYTAASDIYVSTSVSDGASASLLEAMALGLPAVVSDIPGNLEWITEGSDGLVFRKGDPAALAQKILKLARSRKERESLGLAAREEVAKRADWKRNSQIFVEAIEGMARAPSH
ncbi:MAG TPA: glycosyltransferase family 4 protein [Conexivisphaerales archaeon]|nr:glycosyltransferase family 4 protein [Conexivisphaerales archaeon]